MALSEFVVAQPSDDADKVAIYAHDGWMSVVGVIPCHHLKAYFGRDGLTGAQAALLVRSNIDAISAVMRRKYDCGEYSQNSGDTLTPRVVYFKIDDMRDTVTPLSDRALALPHDSVTPHVER
jgi:hypothetical protein